MFKKIILPIAALTSCLILATSSYAIGMGTYAGLQVGRTDIDSHWQVGGRISVGYKFMQYFAAEGGYAEYRDGNNTLDGVAKGIFPFGNGMAIFATAGLAYVNDKAGSGAGITYGLGASTDLSTNTTFSVAWRKINKASNAPAINFLNIGMGYHFNS